MVWRTETGHKPYQLEDKISKFQYKNSFNNQKNHMAPLEPSDSTIVEPQNCTASETQENNLEIIL